MSKYLVVLLSFIALQCYAQVPKGIRYQAIARDNDGLLIGNQNVAIKVSIIDSSALGNEVYVEVHKSGTNQYGLFSISIGNGMAIKGDFDSIAWQTGNKWVKVGIDIHGGNDFAFVTASQLQSVPYALYAATAGKTANNTANNISAVAYDTVTQILNISQGNTQYNTFINTHHFVPNKLNDLADVNASALIGQTLKWNGNQWVAANDSSNPVQQLAIIGNNLAITNGNSISLAPYAQNLALDTISNTLTISNGNTVDLGKYQQQLSANVQGNNLLIGISNGNTVSIPAILGPTGITGATGPQGIQGPQGLQGITGMNGLDGATGVAGPTGPQGIQGPTGPAGTNGIDGATGAVGATGAANINGLPNYLIKFTVDSITGGNSQIVDNGYAVGIGTVWPSARLQINGSNGQNPISVQANGVTKFYMNASGNIAIGGSFTPSYLLDVYSLSTNALARFANSYGNGTGLAANGNGVAGLYLTTGSGVVGNGNTIGVAGIAASSTNTAFGGYFVNDGIYAYVGGWSLSGSTFTPYKIVGNGAVSTIIENTKGEKVTMFAPESPEVLFQDFGTSELRYGRAHVTIDPDFAKNILVDENHPIKVFVQPEGACNGMYIDNKSATGFDVIELNNGRTGIPFSWFIVATRKNEMIPTAHGLRKASFDVRLPIAPKMQETGELK